MAATKTKPERPTSQEIQEREDLAFDLLSRCFHKSQIKKHFKEKYSCDARTVERYLSRARERMAAQAALGKDTLRSESLAFYLSVLRNNTATVKDKIQARERIDRLFGLDAPTNINIGKLESEIERELARLGLSGEASIPQNPEGHSERIN